MTEKESAGRKPKIVVHGSGMVARAFFRFLALTHLDYPGRCAARRYGEWGFRGVAKADYTPLTVEQWRMISPVFRRRARNSRN